MSTSDNMGTTNSSLSHSPSSQSRNAAGVGSNNTPPILFHAVHGDNIRLSRDQAVARRVDSFCKGIAFTNRPVRINEKIYLKFVEMSTSWSGALRFGFTSNDPSNFRSNLPKYACPDLTNKPGNWAKAMTERFAQMDIVLSYHVDETGHVHYGINGEERGIFFDGVNVSGPLWGLVDIYGNTIAMELIEPRQQLNNNRRNTENLEMNILTQQVSNLQIEPELPLQTHNGIPFFNLPFHQTCGTNITLSNTRCVAARCEVHYCQGYVFTSRPLRPLEKLVIQVMQTEDSYVGSLIFGLTSCDPNLIQQRDLPDDANALIDRPEYWVVKKDVAESPVRGDELAFMIRPTGEVQFAKNDQPMTTLMHVDHTQTFWAFFDLYGRTIKIRSLGVCLSESVPNCTMPSRVFDSSNSSLSSALQTDSGGILPINRDIQECVICYEKPVDSVVYKCGHMCMCYTDAMALLRSSQSTAVCPLCRKPMEDVIRIYRA